jgi:hypothetical protein
MDARPARETPSSKRTTGGGYAFNACGGRQEARMKMLLAAALLSAASFAAFAAEPNIKTEAPGTPSIDAESTASAADVGQARRAYRAACERYENHAFCDCLTAGMAQSLSPSDARLATRTIRERITAQGDTGDASDTDPQFDQGNAMGRIEQAESHYTDVCSQYRGH